MSNPDRDDQMNNDADALSDRLTRLASWPQTDAAAAPDAWRAALHAHDTHGATGTSRWRRPLVPAAGRVALAASLLLCVGLGVVLLQSERHDLGSVSLSQSVGEGTSIRDPRSGADVADFTGAPAFDLNAAPITFPWQLRTGASPSSGGGDAAALDGGRSIIHSVSIELRAAEVRTAYLMALRLASVAHGEFVETSNLSGEEPTLHGSVSLRIRAERLDETLAALRELGRVDGERRTSQDVTAQVIDLDSRLRNERRIESELLALLEGRGDAKLEEVLAVRDRLAQVRGTIERVDAQRAATARLVELASVLVVIRPDALPETLLQVDAEESSIGFGTRLRDGWHDGIDTLARSCAMLVRVFVGGLPWWLIAVGMIGAASALLRRTRLPETA